MSTFRREDYYYADTTVTVGAVDQLVDIDAVLVAAGRIGVLRDYPHYVRMETDTDITVKINETTATAMPFPAGFEFDLPAGAIAIRRLYFTHTGAGSAAGDATVSIFAT